MKELIEAYDEYIAMLVSSEQAMLGLFVSHGGRLPAKKIKRGEELRAKIAELKAKVG